MTATPPQIVASILAVAAVAARVPRTLAQAATDDQRRQAATARPESVA